MELDGTLERFGHPVPDAVAMLGALERLSQRLEPGRLRCFALCLFEPRSGSAEGARARLEQALRRADPGACFAPLPERMLVSPGLTDLVLPGGAGEERVVGLLSARASTVRAATAAGFTAWRLVDRVRPGQRRLAFDEVRRMAEEAMRVPTARPRSPETRRGDVLEIPVDGLHDAFARILAAAHEDDAADWVLLDDRLLLYAEDPRAAEHLIGEGAVRSRDVRRADLALRGSELVLSPESEEVERGRVTPWLRAHRRRPARDAAGAPPLGPALDLRARADAIAREIAAAGGLGRGVESVLERRFGSAAALDVPSDESGGRTWCSPSADPMADLVLLGHRVGADAAGPIEAAVAMAIAEAIAAEPPASGVIHGLGATPEEDLESLLLEGLLSEEQERVRGAVYVERGDGSTGLELRGEESWCRRLLESAPAEARDRVRIATQARGRPWRELEIRAAFATEPAAGGDELALLLWLLRRIAG